MRWPTDFAELESLQLEMAAARSDDTGTVVILPSTPFTSVAGCFVCFDKGGRGAGTAGDRGWAAAVTLEAGRVVDFGEASGAAGAAYARGLLAAREGALLDTAVSRLQRPPDVVLVNATGLDHPRRAGMAVHLGWCRGVPTIGVTDRTLLAVGDVPGPWPGSRSPLWIGREQVGWWLRTRPGARPVAVTPGWRMDLDSALGVVESTITSARTPEPIRQARRLARTARSTAG